MSQHVRANLWLLVFSVALSSVVYPLVLFAFGQSMFKEKADGSLLYDKSGNLIGSALIAQPFNGDEYFHPRPSAVGYNASSTAGSNWAGNNYLLRDRVARMLGPIVTYAAGEKKGHLAAPDIEAWFGKDQFGGSAGIVAQWAAAHGTLASNWAKADPLNGAYVMAWAEAHPDDLTAWKKDNNNPEPKPEDLAGIFFASYSKEHPGTFPMAAEVKSEEGKTDKVIQPGSAGTDIQSIFFDMWRQEHADVELQQVPADVVMASGAGLDPDITLDNARFQLDRLAAKRAADAGLPTDTVRAAIEKMLRIKSVAPLNGLAGVPLVNVLEVNLALAGVMDELKDKK